MKMQLYCVYFESANYAGYGEHCLVMADSELDAMSNQAMLDYAEEKYREQDEEQFIEENGEDTDGVIWAGIMTAVPLAGSEFEKYLADPSQAQFYPMID